jgi:hypothetical protein
MDSIWPHDLFFENDSSRAASRGPCIFSNAVLNSSPLRRTQDLQAEVLNYIVVD